MAIISNQDCFKSLIQLKINNEAENKKNASKLDAIKTVKNSRYALYNSSLTNNESLKNTNNAKFGSNYAKSYISPQITQAQSIKSINKITDPIIKEALEKLREVKFLSGDLEYLNAMGVNTVYKSGEEAVKGIIDNNIKIEFAPINSDKAHAQWESENNKIIINDKYKDTKDPAVILAISEAMFHEAGHSKDKDGLSSIQEEIDCLALNTLAFRYHSLKYAKVFEKAKDSAIINDGVALYAKLYFDKDPNKQALVNRIIEKYGDLDFTSPNHAIPNNSILMSGIKKNLSLPKN